MKTFLFTTLFILSSISAYAGGNCPHRDTASAEKVVAARQAKNIVTATTGNKTQGRHNSTIDQNRDRNR